MATSEWSNFILLINRRRICMIVQRFLECHGMKKKIYYKKGCVWSLNDVLIGTTLESKLLVRRLEICVATLCSGE